MMRHSISAFLLFLSATGAARAQTAPVVGVQYPAVSPDGRALALTYGGRVYIVDLADGASRRLTDTGTAQEHPAWSPDGREIVFSARRDGRFRLFIAPIDGGPAREAPGTNDPAMEARTPSWGGGRIVFVRPAYGGTRAHLMTVNPEGGDRRQLTSQASTDRMPAVSPDGTRVAFVSDRSGDEEIWVIGIDGGEATRLTFHRGEDRYPAWSPDGTRLVYSTQRGGARYLAVIDAAGGEPVLVRRGGGQAVWSSGGKHILLVKLPPLPPAYNGNPARLADWERRAPFPNQGAFELFRIPAPAPLDGGEPVALQPFETRRAHNRRVFDEVVETHRRLYYPEGPSRQRWDTLAGRLRPEAEEARDAVELEAIVDRLVAARPLIKVEAHSRRAVVASANPLATEAGLAVLRRGGNVVDAAVAVSFMLGVVEPDASSIGGEGMMLIHLKKTGRTIAIDFKDQAPSHATRDNPAIFRGGRLVTNGPAAVNIPGVVGGMDLAFRKYGSGRVRWSDLVMPAARAAEKGVPVQPGLARSVAVGEQYLKKYPATARIFLPEGRPLRAGDTLINTDYARTLRTIAEEGADAFYRGTLAQAIARDMRTNGGIITAEDLAQYRAIAREPLVGRYRDYEVVTAPPPVSAGSSLIQMLQILDHYPLKKDAHYRRNADSFHFMVEAWKGVSRKRLVADPFLWDVDLSGVLSRERAAAQFEKIDPAHAWPGPALPEDASQREAYRREHISTGTTAAVVADAEGNMVALTQTLSTWGGAFYVSEGLGFLYNNHLRIFRTRPGFGALTPLARSATGICPTLVFRRRGAARVPFMAVSAAGNAWITAAVYEILTGVVDFGLSPQQAVESPRFLVLRKRFPNDRPPVPPRVQYEQGIAGRVVREMRARGHRLQPIGMKGELVMGYAAVAVIDPKDGSVTAGADPRRAHRAMGLP